MYWSDWAEDTVPWAGLELKEENPLWDRDTLGSGMLPEISLYSFGTASATASVSPISPRPGAL